MDGLYSGPKASDEFIEIIVIASSYFKLSFVVLVVLRASLSNDEAGRDRSSAFATRQI